MSRSIGWWIFLLSGWCFLGAWICRKCLCGATATTDKTETVIAPVSKKVTSNAIWDIKDGNSFTEGVDEHWRFNTSKFAHIMPLSADMQSSMAATANYLKNNPDRALTITGLYQEDETNSSILPNLGLARANDINKYMRGRCSCQATQQCSTSCRGQYNREWGTLRGCGVWYRCDSIW